MAASESPSSAAENAILLLMKIDIGDGRTGKIEVRSGEEYIDLAKRFCVQYELPAGEVAPMLAEHIAKSVEETLATQSAQAGPTAPDTGGLDEEQRHEFLEQPNETSTVSKAPKETKAPRTPDTSRGSKAPRQNFPEKEMETTAPRRQGATRDRQAPAGQGREEQILGRTESDRGMPASIEMHSDRVQANYHRLVNREPELDRARSEGVGKSRADALDADSRAPNKQSVAYTRTGEVDSAPERRSFNEVGSFQSPSAIPSQNNRSILRPPTTWDNVPIPMSFYSDMSKPSPQKGGVPIWKKLYNNGMRGKQRKQERIEEERRRWVQPPKPRRAAGPESEEFSHLYTPRAKSAPRERHRGRRGSSGWQEESTAGSESRSSSRKKGRLEEEDGPPVWERLYQECRLKNEQRKMLARMEKEEDAMAGVFDSIPTPSSRRNQEGCEVFDRLYQQGIEKANEKMRKHIEAKQDEDEQLFMHRKSQHDGEVVKPFHPDIAPFARILTRDKHLEEDLDALGVRKKMCLEERDVLRECMQLEGCTFQPQLLPSEYHDRRERRKTVHEDLYELNQTLQEKKQILRGEYSRSAPAKRLSKEERQAVVDRLWSRHEQMQHKLQQERERNSASMHSHDHNRSPTLIRNPLGECHGYGPSAPSTSRPAFRPGGTPDEEASRARKLQQSSADRLLATKAKAEHNWGPGPSRTTDELYAARHLDTMEKAKQREAQERRFDELATKSKTCKGSRRMMDKKKEEHLRALFMVLDRNNEGSIPAPCHPIQVHTLKNYFADAIVADLVVGVLTDHASVSSAVITFELFRELSMHAFTKVLPHGYSGWHVIFGHARRAPMTPTRRATPGNTAEDSSYFGLEVDVEEREADLPFFSEDAVEISPVCGPHPERQHMPGRGRAPAGQFYRDEMERARLREAWLQQKRRHSELKALAQCTFVPQVCTPGLPDKPAAEARCQSELEEGAG